MGVILWLLHFGSPPFSSSSSSDRNYSILQRNSESFWRLHPSVRKWGTEQPIDEDFKNLLNSMLSADIGNRPESIAEVMQHPFFTKETDLVDAHTNDWFDNEALKAAYKAKLVTLFDKNLNTLLSSPERTVIEE